MRWATLAILFTGAFTAGCRGDPQKCERAVRNYATLVYWKQAEVSIAAAPPEQRSQLRINKDAEFREKLDKGLPTLVSQCTSANNKDQINCMIDATDAAQALKCSEPYSGLHSD